MWKGDAAFNSLANMLTLPVHAHECIPMACHVLCTCRSGDKSTQLHAAPRPGRCLQEPARRQLPDAVRTAVIDSQRCQSSAPHVSWSEALNACTCNSAAASSCFPCRLYCYFWCLMLGRDICQTDHLIPTLAQAEPQRHVPPQHQRRAGCGGAPARAARGQLRLPQR
jgi:hypothetical protein